MQLVFGALVAGLNAGLVANDWPAMGGDLIPVGLSIPGTSFFENPVALHFVHRMVAYLIAILIVIHAVALARAMPGSRVAFSSYRLIALVGLFGPVVAFVLGFVVFGTTPETVEILGGAIIVLGVAIPLAGDA